MAPKTFLAGLLVSSLLSRAVHADTQQQELAERLALFAEVQKIGLLIACRNLTEGIRKVIKQEQNPKGRAFLSETLTQAQQCQTQSEKIDRSGQSLKLKCWKILNTLVNQPSMEPERNRTEAAQCINDIDAWHKNAQSIKIMTRALSHRAAQYYNGDF